MTSTELQKVTTNRAGEQPENRGARFSPRIDVVENQNDLIVYVDLPGVKQEDVSLTCKGEQLMLHARCDSRVHGTKLLHAEYRIGDYYRAFTLPEQVDRDGIEASLQDGVLTIRVPKAEIARPKRIIVKS